MARVTVRRSDAHDLPAVCCVCGKDATRIRREAFRRSAGWVSWALLLCGLPIVFPDLFPRPSYAHSVFSVLCVGPFFFGVIFARRSIDLNLPVCDRHRRRGRKGWVMLGVGLLAALATGFGSNLVGKELANDLFLLAFLIGLGSLVLSIALVDDRVRAANIDDRSVTLDRVSDEFAAAVEGGGPRRERSGAVAAGGVGLATARYYRG
jgi:MFS family permease